MRPGEWREELLDEFADTGVLWAATPSMEDQVPHLLKDVVYRYSCGSRLAEICTVPVRVCSARCIGMVQVERINVGVLSYEDMDLLGVT